MDRLLESVKVEQFLWLCICLHQLILPAEYTGHGLAAGLWEGYSPLPVPPHGEGTLLGGPTRAVSLTCCLLAST